MKKILTTVSIMAGSIGMVLAQAPSNQVGGNLSALIATVQRLVNQLVPLAIGLAIASLFYGIVMFMWKGQSDSKAHDQWLKWMGMSILALFVMVSVWGLVGFVGSILGINSGGAGPTIGFPSGPTN